MKDPLVTIPLHEYEKMKRNLQTIDPKFIDGKVMVETRFDVITADTFRVHYTHGKRYYITETDANAEIASRIERLQEFEARYLAYMEHPWIIRIFKKPPTP
jgi:hypothetical protein